MNALNALIDDGAMGSQFRLVAISVVNGIVLFSAIIILSIVENYRHDEGRCNEKLLRANHFL